MGNGGALSSPQGSNSASPNGVEGSLATFGSVSGTPHRVRAFDGFADLGVGLLDGVSGQGPVGGVAEDLHG